MTDHSAWVRVGCDVSQGKYSLLPIVLEAVIAVFLQGFYC